MKKAIVIGGTAGIGYELSKILLSNNYKVCITGIENTLIEDLQNSGRKNLEAKYLDCLNNDTSEKIKQIIQKLGGLDLLILSAGIGNLNKNLGFPAENKANKLNVLAFTEIADFGYRFFEKQGFGHFAAITSLSGLFGSRIAPAYHAAKSYQITYLAGLRQKARRARLSGKSVYVTDLRPGFVKTKMTKGKKIFWAATAKKAANQIFQSIKIKKEVAYVTSRWLIIAIIIKALPNWLLVKL